MMRRLNFEESVCPGAFGADEILYPWCGKVAKKLSWVNWNLTDKQETTGLLEVGASADGKWSIADLSPAGVYIRSELRKLNQK
jgi:endoglucanase